MLKRTFSTLETKSKPDNATKTIVKSKSFDILNLSRDWKQTYLIVLLSSILIKDEEKLKSFLGQLTAMDFISSYSFFSNQLKPVPSINNIVVPYINNEKVVSPFFNFQYIGGGTFGEVYKTEHKLDGKYYAIKKIPMTNGEDCIAEIKILSKLDHPNIVRYFNSFLYQNSLMIQMEYCPGSLSTYLQKEERSEKILKEIISGLCYLHENNIIHFDLKPANILLTEKNQIKIADFGYSRYVLSSIYKSHYYEPSLYICKNDVEYTTKIDVYSFGIILLEFALPKMTTQSEKFMTIQKQLKSRAWETTMPKYHLLLTKCLHLKQNERISTQEINQLYF